MAAQLTLELPHQGNQYSWSDKGSEGRIYSKIDWVLINDEWLISVPSSMASYLPEGISDHCLIKITLIEERLRMQRSFYIVMHGGKHHNSKVW